MDSHVAATALLCSAAVKGRNASGSSFTKANSAAEFVAQHVPLALAPSTEVFRSLMHIEKRYVHGSLAYHTGSR